MVAVPNAMTTFVDGLRVHAADLTPIVANITDLYANRINDGYFSLYSFSGNLANGGVWTTPTPTLTTGTGLGISLSGNTFTLAQGLWAVSFSLGHKAATGGGTLVSAWATTNIASEVGMQIGSSVSASNPAWYACASGTLYSASGITTCCAKYYWSGTAAQAPTFNPRITFMRMSGTN
jgi:hypothetical protein